LVDLKKSTLREGAMGATQQVAGIVNGQIVSVTETPLLTSASTPWSGFLLECLAANVIRQNVWWGWHRTHVNLITKGTLTFQIRQFGRDEWFSAQPGSVLVFPNGFGEAHCSVAESDFELTCVELDPALATQLFGRKGPAGADALSPQLVIEDAHIAALLTSMKLEVSQGCCGGRLYAQSLSVALAAYLENRFSVSARSNRSHKRFSQSQVKRLSDYITANLASDLSLGDLADLVEMSPRQFFRFFSSTFGSTPHQYLLKERVRRAKELLSGGSLPVDIAYRLGFSNQSHFTQVFRKMTGTSPGRFRQEVR
jgi:AraC family transcriptional regulator